MEIEKYKHIIWDWNGTLLDDVWLVVETMNILLDKYNLELINPDRHKEIFEFPIKNYYKNAGFNLDNIHFGVLAKEYISIYNARCIECNLHNNVKNLLVSLKDKSITNSILSASTEDHLLELMKIYELEDLFNEVAGLNNHYATSKVERGRELIKKVNCNLSEVLLIGDTVHDFDVSKYIGCDCLLIANGHNSLKRLQSTKANVVNTIADIFTLM